MPCATRKFGRLQIKAVFFILLLAGHDAVRVTEEVEWWSKSKWNQLHADCSWSLKGCSPGCVRKRLPLDLTPGASCRHTDDYLLKHDGLKNFHSMIDILVEKSEKYNRLCSKATVLNRKCKRREAQIIEAFRFIARAPGDKDFVQTLGEAERKSLHKALKKVSMNFAAAGEEGTAMAEFLEKMKGQKAEFLKDPKGTMAKVMALSSDLLSGQEEAQKRAEQQIKAMPAACEVSAAEEAQGLENLKEMQKEVEEQQGEISLALDGVDKAIDEAVEEEADETEDDSSTSSAVQVSRNSSSQKEIQVMHAIAPATYVSGIFVFLFIMEATPVGWAILGTAMIWSFFATVYCAFGGASRKTLSNSSLTFAPFGTCVKKAFKWLTIPVKFFAKGAYRLGKGIKGLYRRTGGNSSNTTALIEGPTMYGPEPLELEDS